MQERLHKILAHAGYGSRRACEALIESGTVTVNGKVAKVGDKAALGTDDIRVGSQRVRQEKKVYFLLNKPPGFLCTSADPGGRRMVGDLLIGVKERVYPVGRLDADSRGLVLLTNDGDLAEHLAHPRYEVPKTYEAEVEGRVIPLDVRKLVSGVWLSEGKTGPTQVRILKSSATRSLIEITLREGRNREVRRMLAKLHHPVRTLIRTRIGPLVLRGLGVGKFRELTAKEVADLGKTASAGTNRAAAAAKTRRAKPTAAGPGFKKGPLAGRQTSDRKKGGKPEAGGRKVYDFTS